MSSSTSTMSAKMSSPERGAHKRKPSTRGTFPDGEVMVGYTLIVCGTRYASPDLDEGCYEDGEEDDMVSLYAGFVRLGQQPALTRGMVESYLDNFRNA